MSLWERGESAFFALNASFGDVKRRRTSEKGDKSDARKGQDRPHHIAEWRGLHPPPLGIITTPFRHSAHAPHIGRAMAAGKKNHDERMAGDDDVDDVEHGEGRQSPALIGESRLSTIDSGVLQ